MRRLAFLAALAALAGALLARRRRTPATAPLTAAPGAPSVAAPHDEARFVSVAWVLAAPPGEHPELTIRCHQDDALALDRVDVQETPTQVFVTAIARRDRSGPADPPRKPTQETAALSRPLGERELIATPVDAGPEQLDAGPGAPPVYP
jgi:hypothetical protein